MQIIFDNLANNVDNCVGRVGKVNVGEQIEKQEFMPSSRLMFNIIGLKMPIKLQFIGSIYYLYYSNVSKVPCNCVIIFYQYQ